MNQPQTVRRISRKSLEDLVYFATKAPSGHNSQPWRFRIRQERIEIHPDFKYALPAVDPQHRELYISLGTALENLRIAAQEFGYEPKWEIVRNVEAYSFIRVDLEAAAAVAKDPLFGRIEQRQSNRRIYEGEMISEESIESFREISRPNQVGVYFFRNGDPDFAILKDYILRGNEIQMRDESFKEELLDWIRFNQGHIRATNDGLSYQIMGSPPTPKFIGRRIVSSFLNPKAQNKTDEAKIDSSSHLVLLTTVDNTIPEWIRLGVYLERLLLNFTAAGIASAFLNPACEVPELAGALRMALPINGEYPTLVVRIGYAEPMPYSPRRAVDAVLA